MIETFSLKNFRCFEDNSISPLSRINLITGKNNSGKTAFLEGLFLHVGGTNPELPLNINVFRGVAKLVPNAQEIWGWLFTNKDFKRAIRLSSYDDAGEKRELVISLETLHSSVLAQGGDPPHPEKESSEFISTAANKQQLVLEFHNPDGSQSRVGAQLSNKQIIFARDKKGLIPFPPSIFMATRIRNYAEDAERYSRLEEAGIEQEVIETLQQIEPKLKRFVVSVVGGIPSLRADLGQKKLIPLSYMGEGMNRLLSLALAIPICQNGLLLIDEIENGIHHSALPRVCRSVRELANKFNVQILASTHSWECIRAAHEVYAGSDVYDFRLFEFTSGDEEKKGQVKITAYDRDTLKAKLERNEKI